MTKGDKRRNRRRYKVRYDRLAVFLLVMIVLAVVITSCVKAVTGKDVTEPIENQLPTAAPTDPAEATAPWEDVTLPEPEPVTEISKYKDYIAELHEYDDMFSGDLVLVNSDHEYKFIDGDIDVQTLYDHKSDCYDVSDNVVCLDSNVIEKLNDMMEAFAEERAKSPSGKSEDSTEAVSEESTEEATEASTEEATEASTDEADEESAEEPTEEATKSAEDAGKKDDNSSSTGIWVFDGFRTFNEQTARHSEGRSSFEAGHTDYHSGRTFDMLVMHDDATTDPFKPEDGYKWFADHAADYGFIVRFPEDKSDLTGERARTYTYRYVGVPHAKYMTKHGLCLEEYIDALKGYTIDKPLEVEGDGCGYRIYYVPAPKSGKIEVLVPEKERYTVSGNNSDGFIVTVTTK